MSVLERQVNLGRELFEINTGTVRRLVELQTESIQKYFETNQEFASKLPEIKDVSSFVELQRDYGQAVWEGIQDSWKARGEVVREAVENAGSLVRDSFSTETEEATAPKAKPAAEKAAA